MQVQTQNQNQVLVEKTPAEKVLNRIVELTNQGKLDLPKNYSAGNALSSAWLIIQDTKDNNGRPALEVCTKESVVNSLLEMAILGLNPVKKQGYFIVYGNKLGWYTSYFGKCSSIKRLKGIENEPIGTIIYEGDEVELDHNELGEEIILSHKTSWENKLKGKRVGAYATVTVNGIERSAVMTISEIKESWLKNPSKGNKRDHTDFEGEFMKRTAINRLIKMILQTSNDDDLLAETLIKNEDEIYEMQNQDFVESTAQEVRNEVENKANKAEMLTFDKTNNVEEEKPKMGENEDILKAYTEATAPKQQAPQRNGYF
ncbi:MAG: recombinase RecT [Prevotella sp.]|nr:recombinase RecT [Staphylococcus sp.]MCM1349914.1 recombinase RecT [Prevotella sp.]